MADYRRIMTLLLEQRSYRQIEVVAGCSHRAIARARRTLDEQQITNPAQLEALTAEGRTLREIRRCLKRYLAREIYRRLNTAAHTEITT